MRTFFEGSAEPGDKDDCGDEQGAKFKEQPGGEKDKSKVSDDVKGDNGDFFFGKHGFAFLGVFGDRVNLYPAGVSDAFAVLADALTCPVVLVEIRGVCGGCGVLFVVALQVAEADALDLSAELIYQAFKLLLLGVGGDT